MKIEIHKEVEIESTIRTELLSSMFEVPAKTKLSVSLSGDLPLDDRPWNIGLIVGPSGSGKTLLLNNLFGGSELLFWEHKSVIDDFAADHSMEDIARVCQSVGFNTIPSYLRPYSVLSNGERFRVEVARRLLSPINPICIDEFTSVVDRQVAQFGCHAIQKYIRGCEHKQFIAASCHYDIIPWLQPDWILEPGNPCKFTWRSLCQRPPITVSVSRVQYKTWELFRDFHYMTAELNRAARCYGLYVSSKSAAMEERLSNEQLHSYNNRSSDHGGDGNRLRITSAGFTDRVRDSNLVLQRNDEESCQNGYKSNDAATSQNARSVSTTTEMDRSVHRQLGVSHPTYRIASMCGVLHRPHPKVSDICGFTRMVTLPDFQGLGLAFVLACKVASAYKALGKRLHSYPNHPAWIRSYQRSSLWMQIKDSGSYSPRRGSTSTVGGFGNKRCAVFLFVGSPMNADEAKKLIYGEE